MKDKIEKVKMKIEKMTENAVMPTKGTPASAGLDLTAIDFKLKDEGKNGVVIFKTGLKAEIPDNYFGSLHLRSGIASKGIWMLANSTGIIDSDYRGEIMIMLRYVSAARFFKYFNFQQHIDELLGNRIAQLIIQPYASGLILKSGKVKDTVRSSGGFGSTGK